MTRSLSLCLTATCISSIWIRSSFTNTPICAGQYYFKCRNKDVVFTEEMAREINAQIDHLCTLRFTKEELDYLRSVAFRLGREKTAD